jgi:hypothetical protein
LCQRVDLVVLHLFPYDIVPVLALAAGCDSTKVVFVNHSDHCFWIGASVAHSIIHFRPQSAEFLRKNRGLDPDQSSLLPIPLFNSAAPVDRIQAKQALGYPPDVVLLVTIASPFKYSVPGQISFLDLVAPVLIQLPEAVLLAVGPEAEGAWQSANIQTNGRIVPLGTRSDNDLLYSAADVYLDSFPCSSITSLIEAGGKGVPLLGHGQPNSELHLLGASPALIDHAMELANDPESYRKLLTRLIKDAEFRSRSGRRAQSSSLATNTGSNWTRAVNDIYAKLGQVTERKCLVAKEDTFDSGALILALGKVYHQHQHPFRWRGLIGKYVGALPYWSRFFITLRLRNKGFGLCVLNLLPPPADTIIRTLRRWVKRLMRK